MPINIVRIVLLACLACAGVAHAQGSGRITRVVLYPGSATVERSVPVSTAASSVELAGLPATFDVRTLRVEADAGIRIGEVAVRQVARAEGAAGREGALETKIQALKDEKALLEVDEKSAQMARDYLASLGGKPAPGDKAPDAKSIASSAEAIRRGGAEAYATIQRTAVKKRALDRQIAAFERDLAQVRSGARDTRTLVISYQASRAGEVRAAYQVAGAGWRPAYRASLDSAASQVELERQATITQRTGEDWSGVSLRLSTGQPRAAAIIDPASWQLTIRPPAALQENLGQSLYSAPAAAPVAARSLASARGRAEAPAEIVELQTQYATEFEVPGSVELPADGRQVTVSLSKQSLPVKQRVRVVPRRDAAAMVTAEAALPEGVWLPGEVQLYRDGSYIGASYWNASSAERLALPFGRDDRIVVAVKRVKNRSGSGGFVGQKAERQIGDLYTITSRHKAPVELLVLEASPVAANDQIKVEAVFEPKPKAENWEERRGVVAWEQVLSPGETLRLNTDYTITYPKDAAVIGLP